MKLIVQLVTWNGERYLPALFDSLKRQILRDWRLIILDNGSTDATVNFLRAHAASAAPLAEMVFFDKNSGFVAGHNTLFARHAQNAGYDDLTMLINQDTVLEPDCFMRVCEFMRERTRAAVCGPRVMQLNAPQFVDSLGIGIYKNGRALDLCNGKFWDEELVRSLPFVTVERGRKYAEVFGVSGALPCYRTAVARDVPCSGGLLFDPSFFSYKEDVDLAHRLRRMGWKAYTLLDCVAYHDRSAGGPASGGAIASARHWNKKSAFIRRYSLQNHWAILLKHLPFSTRALWFELQKFLFAFFTMPRVTLQVFGALPLRKLLRARRILRRAQRAAGSELRVWMM